MYFKNDEDPNKWYASYGRGCGFGTKKLDLKRSAKGAAVPRYRKFSCVCAGVRLVVGS